jgi:nicotinamidase-related amidase
LIIIDVQAQFDIEETYIQTLTEKIKHAMKNNWYIIIVELIGGGIPTVKEITDLVKKYDKYYFLFKENNDASGVIYKLLYKLRLYDANFYICGMYTNWCVKETVENLDFSVNLIENCCQSRQNIKADHDKAIQEMKKLKHVTII